MTPARESLATLPRGEFSVQRQPAGDSAERLLSVFLTPQGGGAPDHPVPVELGRRRGNRGARHDGFIQHEGELIVVIEAKRHDEQGWHQAQYPGELDVDRAGVVRFVSWTELVDQWTRFTEEPGLVGHSEREVISDFLDLIAENSQINAYSSLVRCRRLSLPLSRRLQVLLTLALDRPTDYRSFAGPGGHIQGLSGLASVLALSLHDTDDQSVVRLRVWPAVQAGEAREFYGDLNRLREIAAIANTPGDGSWTWRVWTGLELKSQRDQNPVALTDEEGNLEKRFLAAASLLGSLNRMVPTPKVAEHLKPFVAAGLTTRREIDAAVSEASDFGYSKWKVVAPACVFCAWPLDVATGLDNSDNATRNGFILEVREAARQLTELVGVRLSALD